MVSDTDEILSNVTGIQDIYVVTQGSGKHVCNLDWIQFITDQHLVSFNTNGGSKVDSQGVYPGETAATPTEPMRAGHTFAGWYSDRSLTEAYNFETEVVGDITVYAKWTTNSYTVTFNSNGGGSVNSQEVAYGARAVKPADPIKTGSFFEGWYTDETLTEPYDFNTPVTADLNLYAKWARTIATHTSYLNGYEDGTMRPNGDITRAEAVAVIVRTLVEGHDESVNYTHGFSDVNDKLWYAHYIGWAAENNLVTGDGDGKFRPEATITREELMAIVARTDEVLKAGELDFKDTADISSWARDVVYTCVENGWVKGDENQKLRPKDNITRAEMVTIINRMLDRDNTTEASLADVEDKVEIYPDAKAASNWWYYEIIEASNTHSYYIDDSSVEIWVNVS